MAIYNGRILMRKGNEADFDPSKLMSGEWAVSLDAGIVRICLEAGKVIRMATYEAFEEDMKQIEAILLECQSIEEAVRRINTEVSEKLNACAEYVQQAKNYSEQAKTSEENAKSYMQSAKTSEENAKVYETNAKASENSAKEYENSAKLTEERAREVFESIPEDYSTISNDLYELAIKETASGEEIHVNDSSNLKLREFSLYGKAEQNTTTGKNLLPNNATTKTVNGVTFTINEDKSVSVSGTASARIDFVLYDDSIDASQFNGKYLSGCVGGSWNTYFLRISDVTTASSDNTNGSNKIANLANSGSIRVAIVIQSGVTVNTTFYPMISVEGGEYEPYTGGQPSPNPQYPQPIEVSGASGSVEVKSYGKNLLKTSLETTTQNGVECVKQADGSFVLNGKATARCVFYLSRDVDHKLDVNKKYKLFSETSDLIYVAYTYIDENGTTKYHSIADIPKASVIKNIYIEVPASNVGVELKNVVIKPMLVDTSLYPNESYDTYEPYKGTTSTIPTENGLAGIKVSSNGNYTDSNGQQWICDEIVKNADGSGERIQKYKKIVLDGINVPFVVKSSSTLNNIYVIDVDDIKCVEKNWYVIDVLCTHFLKTDSDTGYNNDIKCIYNSADRKMLYFGFGLDTELTTIAKANAWLQENNVTVIYPLAEPIHAPLTAEEIAEIEKLHTFYPITNISNDFDCGMSVTYYCDSKNYINNQLAIMKQEQEEAMANMLLLMPTEVQAMMIENDTNDLLKESEI